MGFAGKAGRLLGCAVAVIIGIAAAAAFFFCIMIVKVEDSYMLPAIEPGSRVIAVRTHLPADIGVEPEVNVGDLVVYKAPYYEIDCEGTYVVRRVSGIKDGMVAVSCDTDSVSSEKVILSKEKILGKVVYHG